MQKHLNNYANLTKEIVESGEHGKKHANSVVGVPVDARDAFDISTGDKDQKVLLQVNQVILDNSQHVEDVSTTEVENQPHLN